MPSVTPALSATAPATPGSGGSTKGYAIVDVAVVDVEKGIILPDQTVILAGERIERIGAAGEVAIPQGVETIEGRGLYLMPGLVDAHVHTLDAPIFGRLLIANGVLLVRDMGMPNEYILPLRDQLNRGAVPGPEMVATGAILDGDPPQIPTISLGVETPEEGRAVVRRQAEAGVDMIKVYSTLDRETFLAILAEAHRLGLKVVGHVPDTIGIEEAAEAGMDSIEHWFGFDKEIGKLLGEPVGLTFKGMGADLDYFRRLDEADAQALQDFYQLLKESGVSVVPTVITSKVFPDVDALDIDAIPHNEYISQDLFSLWKSQWAGQKGFPDFVWQNWARMVSQMNAAGVPLMVGTDLLCPGILAGYSVHAEMALWQEAGIPAADILRSATLIPAQFMGLGERLGSVQAGKTASLVLVRANPLEDIRNAQEIEGVFLRGEYNDREALDRLLREARDLAATSTP